MPTSNSESAIAAVHPPVLAVDPTSWGVKTGDLGKIHAYLESHPDMIDVAESICRAARQEFGPQAELLLQVYRDPEIDDEYLALYVRLSFYGDDFLPRVRSISAAHEEQLFGISGDILVTTDFRFPRE